MSTATSNNTQNLNLWEVTEHISHAVWMLLKCVYLTVHAICTMALQILAYPVMVGAVILLGMLMLGGIVLSVSLLIEAARHFPALPGFT